MTGRELGCRLSLLVFAAVSILGFFSLLVGATNEGLRAAVLRKQQLDTKYDLQIVMDGLRKYADTHDGKLPPMKSSEAVEKALYPQYVAFDNAFTRIGDNAHYLPNPAYSGKSLSSLPPDAILFAEPAPAPLDKAGKIIAKTRGVLHADGTVVRLLPDAWKEKGWE